MKNFIIYTFILANCFFIAWCTTNMIEYGVTIIDLGLSIFSLVRIINDVVALNKIT